MSYSKEKSIKLSATADKIMAKMLRWIIDEIDLTEHKGDVNEEAALAYATTLRTFARVMVTAGVNLERSVKDLEYELLFIQQHKDFLKDEDLAADLEFEKMAKEQGLTPQEFAKKFLAALGGNIENVFKPEVDLNPVNTGATGKKKDPGDLN